MCGEWFISLLLSSSFLSRYHRFIEPFHIFFSWSLKMIERILFFLKLSNQKQILSKVGLNAIIVSRRSVFVLHWRLIRCSKDEKCVNKDFTSNISKLFNCLRVLTGMISPLIHLPLCPPSFWKSIYFSIIIKKNSTIQMNIQRFESHLLLLPYDMNKNTHSEANILIEWL